MGWKGEGLGKNQDGLKSHVKITKRSTNLGLGTEDTGSNNDRIDAFAGFEKLAEDDFEFLRCSRKFKCY